MRSPRKNVEEPQFLSGWKEIANYLGKGVRTVQRYELQLGFPVRRPAGKSRGSVVATKAEMDAWVSASPIRAEFRLSKPPMDAHSKATWTAIAEGMREMGRLRDQMKALRIELRRSVNLLRDGVQGLWGELNADRWHGMATARFSDRMAGDKRALALSNLRNGARKVN